MSGSSSPFGRRDVPPAGVADYLSFEAGNPGDDPIVTGIGHILPAVIRIGETAQLIVAGGPPDGLVSAHLYRFSSEPGAESGFRFAADIGPIELDPNGNGQLAISPRPGDPPGAYGVVVLPAGPAAPTAVGNPKILAMPDDYVDVASAAGLICRETESGQIPDASAIACQGRVGGADIQMYMFASDEGDLFELSATAIGAPEAAWPLFAKLARVASGEDAAARWVESSSPGPEPLQRRFGDVPVELYEEFDGSWTIFIGLGSPTGLPPEGWAGFEVRP